MILGGVRLRSSLLARNARVLIICGAPAIASACSASHSALPLLPISPTLSARDDGKPNVATVSPESATADALRGGEASWVDPIAQTENLLYVSNVSTVTMYSYPKGKLVGTLRGFYRPEGECVDAVGDVYVTNLGTNQIFEYAHGVKKRLRVLRGYGGPVGCSIDPTTGDLAVSSISRGSGGLAVYKGARGKPRLYKDPAFSTYYFCGYDSTGNLFVDGQSSNAAFEFAELAKGDTSLKTVTLDKSIGYPGGIQWDGRYVAVGDQDTSIIYQFQIKAHSGKEAGSTPLGSHASEVSQFFILAKKIIAPNVYFTKRRAFSDVLFFDYPAGGKATKKITIGVKTPVGAVVSKATSFTYGYPH